jgi:hypothetical protein
LQAGAGQGLQLLVAAAAARNPRALRLGGIGFAFFFGSEMFEIYT